MRTKERGEPFSWHKSVDSLKACMSGLIDDLTHSTDIDTHADFHSPGRLSLPSTQNPERDLKPAKHNVIVCFNMNMLKQCQQPLTSQHSNSELIFYRP